MHGCGRRRRAISEDSNANFMWEFMAVSKFERCFSVKIYILCVFSEFALLLKGQYHGRYHDFWPKLTKFKF